MCNDYGVDIPFRLFVEAFEELGMPLDVSGGIPNLEPRDEIWPSERAPVIRARLFATLTRLRLKETLRAFHAARTRLSIQGNLADQNIKVLHELH